jgi:hypothetical protein
MKSYPVDKKLVLATIKKYKDEILDQCDWWYGLEHHDINVFCLDDEPYDTDAVFHINIHTLGDNGVNDMFEEQQNMMQSMTREELGLL